MEKADVGIVVDGGVGKHVAFSAVLAKAKKKYGKIILVSAYPEVFLGNDNVYRNFPFSTPYLFEDYLSDIKVIKSEPYLGDTYRFAKKHLIEAYADILGVDYDEKTLPNIYAFDHEEDAFKTFQTQVLQGKEYIVIQITGGTSYYTPQNVSQKIIKSRDYPKELGQKFVDIFTAKYPNMKVIQVGLPTEPQLQKVFYMTNLQARAYFPVIEHCTTFVVIDSFLNHISAGYNKKGIVLWGGTNPDNLGYTHNVNLSDKSLCGTIFCNRPNTFLFDTQAGTLWQCNKKYNCMRIPPETILEEVSKIMDVGPVPVNGKCTNCVPPVSAAAL